METKLYPVSPGVVDTARSQKLKRLKFKDDEE
jgi:hypothetical protein